MPSVSHQLCHIWSLKLYFHTLPYPHHLPLSRRLLDFVEKGRVSFANCKYLVLDEADRMLDMGFMPEIEKMVEDPNMPKKAPEGDRQTLMFSATFPDEVQESAQEFLNDYLFLTIGLVGGACSDVRQEFHEVARNEKRDKLEELMQVCSTGSFNFKYIWLRKCAHF